MWDVSVLFKVLPETKKRRATCKQFNTDTVSSVISRSSYGMQRHSWWRAFSTGMWRIAGRLHAHPLWRQFNYTNRTRYCDLVLLNLDLSLRRKCLLPSLASCFKSTHWVDTDCRLWMRTMLQWLKARVSFLEMLLLFEAREEVTELRVLRSTAILVWNSGKHLWPHQPTLEVCSSLYLPEEDLHVFVCSLQRRCPPPSSHFTQPEVLRLWCVKAG